MPTKRFNRLIGHLVQLEHETGKDLRMVRRHYGDNLGCPMEEFAPDFDKDGIFFHWADNRGVVRYGFSWNPHKDYKIYTFEDSMWWTALTPKTRELYLSKVETWLKERKED